MAALYGFVSLSRCSCHSYKSLLFWQEVRAVQKEEEKYPGPGKGNGYILQVSNPLHHRDTNLSPQQLRVLSNLSLPVLSYIVPSLPTFISPSTWPQTDLLAQLISCPINYYKYSSYQQISKKKKAASIIKICNLLKGTCEHSTSKKRHL